MDKRPGPTDVPPMRGALTALLDGVPGSRRVFRHLAAIEHELQIKDEHGAFLYDAPPDQLKVAQRQLDGLIDAEPSEGLQGLRLTLLEAIQQHEHAARRADARQPLSSFFVDHKLQVAEARETDFAEIQAAWLAAPPAAPKPKA